MCVCVYVCVCVCACVWRARKNANSSELSILKHATTLRLLLMMKNLPKNARRKRDKGYYQRNRNDCLLCRPYIWRTDKISTIQSMFFYPSKVSSKLCCNKSFVYLLSVQIRWDSFVKEKGLDSMSLYVQHISECCFFQWDTTSREWCLKNVWSKFV